jgi:hypothetical protein
VDPDSWGKPTVALLFLEKNTKHLNIFKKVNALDMMESYYCNSLYLLWHAFLVSENHIRDFCEKQNRLTPYKKGV